MLSKALVKAAEDWAANKTKAASRCPNMLLSPIVAAVTGFTGNPGGAACYPAEAERDRVDSRAAASFVRSALPAISCHRCVAGTVALALWWQVVY